MYHILGNFTSFFIYISVNIVGIIIIIIIIIIFIFFYYFLFFNKTKITLFIGLKKIDFLQIQEYEY